MERLEVSVVAGLATGEPLGAVSTCDASWVSEDRRPVSSDDADAKEFSLGSDVLFAAPGRESLELTDSAYDGCGCDALAAPETAGVYSGGSLEPFSGEDDC